jgi:hypothetical protein
LRFLCRISGGRACVKSICRAILQNRSFREQERPWSGALHDSHTGSARVCPYCPSLEYGETWLARQRHARGRRMCFPRSRLPSCGADEWRDDVARLQPQKKIERTADTIGKKKERAS